MRVLVTGHDGYIGTLAGAAASTPPGTSVVGLDSGLFRDCTFGRRTSRDVPALRKDIRDVASRATSRASTRSCTSPAISNDPLGDLNAGRDLRHQPPRHRRAWRDRWPRRPASSASCSRRRAASTAPAATTIDETRDVQPGDALRRVQGAGPSATCARWPTTTSARPTCATPPPTACRPACAATSWSTTSPATPSRPARCCSRATARPGGRSCTSRTSPRAFVAVARGAARAGPQRGLQRRPHRGELPDPRGRRDRRRGRARVGTVDAAPRAPSPDKRNYRVNCDKHRRDAAGLPAAVDGAQGRRGALRRLPAARPRRSTT